MKAEVVQAVAPFFGGQCKTKPMKNFRARISKPVCNFATLTQNHGKVANIAGTINAWKVA